jgi:YgiT-type zinc finger domain-containing protein
MTFGDTRPCPACGGLMKDNERDDVLTYEGREEVTRSFGWWCSSCGEGILGGEVLARSENAFVELKAGSPNEAGGEDPSAEG